MVHLDFFPPNNTDEIDREILSNRWLLRFQETIRSIREIVVATRVETSRLFLATVYPLTGVNLISLSCIVGEG